MWREAVTPQDYLTMIAGEKDENMDNWDWLFNRSQTLELNQEPPKKRSANRCNAEFGFCVR